MIGDMRRLIALIMTLVLLIPSVASADDPAPWIAPVITPLAKGTIAPFTGILLTPEAVARVIAEAKDCPKRAQVEADNARAVEKARGDKALADVRSDAKRDHEVQQAGIDQRDGNIKDLTTRLQASENARGNTWLWAGGGVLAGAALVVLSIVTVSYAK